MNTKIVKYFIDSNKLSSFRTYLLIKIKFNGNLAVNGDNISILATSLGTSKDNIRKHIKQLLNIGMIEQGGKNWIHAVGNKRFAMYHGELSLYSYDFKESQLTDIKRFRTLCRAIEMQVVAKFYSDTTCVNKEEISIAYRIANESDNAGANKPAPRYVVSPSFISVSTNRNQSTVSKHRLRAKKHGLLSYNRTFEVSQHTEAFLKGRSNFVNQNTPIFKLENAEIVSKSQIADLIDYETSDALKGKNSFVLKSKSGILEAVVSEESPEVIFNFKLSKARVTFNRVELVKFKENRAIFCQSF